MEDAHDLSEEKVADEQGDGVVPAGVDGGISAACVGVVDDVVVEEGGVVEHFDGGGEEECAAGSGLAEGVGGEECELRAQHFTWVRGDECFDVVKEFCMAAGHAVEILGAHLRQKFLYDLFAFHFALCISL